MSKTVFHRSKAKGDVDRAYQLIVEAARLQLNKGQINSGHEEAMLMLESYVKDKVPCDDKSMDRVLAILGAFPSSDSSSSSSADRGTDDASTSAPGSSDDLPTPLRQYKAIVLEAIRWARRSGGSVLQTSDLHSRLGMYLWTVGGMKVLSLASQHLARAADGINLGAVLASAAAKGTRSERDLFLLRGILQVLAAAPTPKSSRGSTSLDPYEIHRRLEAAAELMKGYCRRVEMSDSPLLNFTKLYLEALHHQSRVLVTMLRDKYQPSLNRDVDLMPLLERIDWVVLGVAPPAGGGIFGDLFKMMLGGGDDD